MPETITVTIAPDHNQTRLLIQEGTAEILRARLAPPTQSHPRAASTLLEGLALWYQRPLSVVLCVDDTLNSPSLDLCDALGFGRRTLHYDVGIAVRDRRPSRHRIGGLGDFRELRRFAVGEVLR
jgi:hypothetical protein